jgi:adenosylcobinamide kinase / adenosylcobinamide-phosphate guanylyltransferase
MGKLILLLGGARSGKSSTAERMAGEIGGADVLYIATAQAFDDEMSTRISKHRAARPQDWQTREAPLNLTAALHTISPLPAVVLLDCVTLLASNALLALPDPEQAAQEDANRAVLDEIEPLLPIIRTSVSTWIVVSNEVGMGVVPPYKLGRLYRDALGAANQRLAAAADEVLLLVAGLPWRLK